MKKSFKTFEEFIGDETTDSLRKKALEIQAKDGDVIALDPDTQGTDDGSEDDGSDDDGSGDEMGTDLD
jgi:hypothetical protein